MRNLGKSLNLRHIGVSNQLCLKDGLKQPIWRGFDDQEAKTMSSTWKAISNLLRREWFTRLRVLQEIKLASSAIVLVGRSKLHWDVFQRAMMWIPEPRNTGRIFQRR